MTIWMRGRKKCICYHAVEKAQILNKSREKPSALTLLFSLCITPITRTLMGYRWASMMKRQKSVLSNPVVRCNRSVSVSLWFGDEGEMLRRCICIRLRRCGCEWRRLGGKYRYSQESPTLRQKTRHCVASKLNTSNVKSLFYRMCGMRQNASWTHFAPKEIIFCRKSPFPVNHGETDFSGY